VLRAFVVHLVGYVSNTGRRSAAAPAFGGVEIAFRHLLIHLICM
jgi:hypothetical protein